MTSTTLEEKIPLTRSIKDSSTRSILSTSRRKGSDQHTESNAEGEKEEEEEEKEEEEDEREVIKAEERMIFYLNGLSWVSSYVT